MGDGWSTGLDMHFLKWEVRGQTSLRKFWLLTFPFRSCWLCHYVFILYYNYQPSYYSCYFLWYYVYCCRLNGSGPPSSIDIFDLWAFQDIPSILHFILTVLTFSDLISKSNLKMFFILHYILKYVCFPAFNTFWTESIKNQG